MVWLLSFVVVQSFANQYAVEWQVTASVCVQLLVVAVTASTFPRWLAATLGWRSTCFLWRHAMVLLRRLDPVETRPTATVVINEAVAAIAEEVAVVVGTNGFAVTIAASSTEMEATLVATVTVESGADATVAATEDLGVAATTAQKPKVATRTKAKGRTQGEKGDSDRPIGSSTKARKKASHQEAECQSEGRCCSSSIAPSDNTIHDSWWSLE
jgi:hypothetical protein